MQLSCLFTLSNFLAVPFVSERLFAFRLLRREQCQRHWEGETSTLGSGAQAVPLLSIPFPSWPGLDWLRSSGELSITDPRGSAHLLLTFQGLLTEFTRLDCQVPVSVHFPLQSLGSKVFFGFFYFIQSLPSRAELHWSLCKHPRHDASQGSPRLPSFLARRRRRRIRKLKSLTCLSNKIIHGRWVAEQHSARLPWIIHNMVSLGTGMLLWL